MYIFTLERPQFRRASYNDTERIKTDMINVSKLIRLSNLNFARIM